MSHEVKIHEAQTKILRELLFVPQTNFANLQKITGLEGDHAKFHIKRLVELEYVDKTNGAYSLSVKGKEYANKLDTDDNTIERQPKVAVIIAIQKNGKYVFQERLKQPYYGFWGLPTGKVRWGEQIVETATREAKEETGLEVEFKVLGIYHELVNVEGTGEYMEDKMFFVCQSTKVSGQLMEDFEGGHNEWATFKDVLDNRKTYVNDQAIYAMLDGKNTDWLVEDQNSYSAEEF